MDLTLMLIVTNTINENYFQLFNAAVFYFEMQAGPGRTKKKKN
jgi:hypothetical protein